ncbi:damage-control phosphatase ARMT1 family protein [Streptosporangium sp. CA-135522]|uniref:damage-control phosphatase ARMT1 family protein n=1 Tax=Streptosporangium sp. CA-135522 TaxID=3240072 RepID=UPI003D91DA0C
MADGDAQRRAGRPEVTSESPVIRSDVPGSFPWGVLHDRHPALIRKVRDATPYGPDRQRALDLLLKEITDGVIGPIEGAAPDADLWRSWDRGHLGRRWDDAPFLWAEGYFYRKLLGAVGYFDPGPWRGVDPFEPFKQAELLGEGVEAELRAIEDLPGMPAGEQARTLMHRALWGNRADLGFRISAAGKQAAGQVAGLLADDGELVWSAVDASRSARICLVADNAGGELLPDLALIDHLLHARGTEEVLLHVKPSPYYVSDAVTADVVACLRRLSAAGGRAGEMGDRLWGAMGSGRLAVRAHAFSCAPLPYEEMPDDLREEFASASLTIMKGDLNYRRLVGDRAWPPTTAFASAVGYFPGPVAALRTLKCDVVVGLEAGVVAALDATGRPWRTSGTHALIQVRP